MSAFRFFHYPLENGFWTVWILFCSIFVLIGLGMTYSTLRAMNKDRRIEGNEMKYRFAHIARA
jgi:hypothetical protein